jgi:hypothetical protein
MKSTATIVAALFAAVVVPQVASAAELQRVTLDAWNAYVRDADAHMRDRAGAGNSFLWADEEHSREQRLRKGELVVAPPTGRGTQEVPGGLIHHWIGAAIFPNGSVASLLATLHDYEGYPALYKPAVTEAHALGCVAGDQEFSMTWQRRVLFVNAAVEALYQSRDVTVTPTRGYNISHATRIQEIEDYGRASQHLLPAGTGRGFMWRVHSIMRYEQRPAGLYVELEVMALTRDVPASFHWLVNPIMNHLSIESLTTTLQETREAVKTLTPDKVRAAACNGAGGTEAVVTPKAVSSKANR